MLVGEGRLGGHEDEHRATRERHYKDMVWILPRYGFSSRVGHACHVENYPRGGIPLWQRNKIGDRGEYAERARGEGGG